MAELCETSNSSRGGTSKNIVQPNSFDESSDSEGEEVRLHKAFHRRVSTSKQIKHKACTKEGYLLKQTSSFQRWRRRYFKLKGRKLFYAKESNSEIYEEVELVDVSVAESSTKNLNNSFRVINPFRTLHLIADSRKDMEDWISAIRSASNKDFYDSGSEHIGDMLSGMHNWYACSHARPTYCNVCREALPGVTSHGLSCEVCKLKAHKRCAVRAGNNCKWTTLASIGKDIIEEDDGGLTMPHQWLEGNLPVSAKCAVCDKTCGSVLRLQDSRCLWCKAMVHAVCKTHFAKKCPLGQCKVSIIPPITLNCIDSDGYWQASRHGCNSPLLVFVNSKSGDNQGVKFLRRFKQLLNPAQVFDLMNSGPRLGLRLFKKFDTFRILVCGGDGSVGWVLTQIDKMDLHKQCQIGVLPLGTGNDLARVLGWGTNCDDDTLLPAMLEKLEHSGTKMLDRWSIWVNETDNSVANENVEEQNERTENMTAYEDSVALHLAKILQSEKNSEVISSAKVLCKTVKDFLEKIGESYDSGTQSGGTDTMKDKCATLQLKLNSLLQTLNEEAQATPVPPGMPVPVVEASHDGDVEGAEGNDKLERMQGPATKVFKPRDALMSRANSLKKAVRQIIEQTEKAVDEQNEQTKVQEERTRRVHGMLPSTSASSHFEDIKEKDDASTEKEILEEDKETGKLETHMKRFSVYTSKARERKKEKDFSLKPYQQSCPMRRVSQGSTFATSVTAPVNIAQRFGSMDNLELLPGLDTLFGPTLGRSNPMLSKTGLGSNALCGGLVSKVLLANADALCAAVSPLMDHNLESVIGYTEKCVMNNYFGIGLDAKIALDFHTRREEHPEKCKSRTKNMMWYGMLGGKELLHRTYRNLEQKVQLECDGYRIPLPSLQGIVVLNIPSYMGGANFWGGSKEDETFAAPSFDDRILEVVAVFGGMQMAVSKLITLQHHRIAQCRVVKVTILGDEPVPVQVDGEAWMQSPGYMKIIHKNRAHMLVRDKVFESTLKSWTDKQRLEQQLQDFEMGNVKQFCEMSAGLIRSVQVLCMSHASIDDELMGFVNSASAALDKLYPSGKLLEGPSRRSVIDLVNSVKLLHNETSIFLARKAYSLQLQEESIANVYKSLNCVDNELRHISRVEPHVKSQEEENPASISKRSKGRFRMPARFKNRSRNKDTKPGMLPAYLGIQQWSAEEVGNWLTSMSLSEYKDAFIRHDIRGAELLHLERRDLKDLGVSKVGHIKRILQAIKDMNTKHLDQNTFHQAAGTSSTTQPPSH
ncbi:diacylglycerol kinase delta-like isoform X3 [Anneissia japonica]|uniref:diacylglycerol kinase delta-like isoform X3 n=1 Tax=Anneissia japonica TaxID=1529436 RepID=UPI001425A285|nr:diacylglycerol kinase delta-like isoform X3 [Anneissia japonica]